MLWVCLSAVPVAVTVEPRQGSTSSACRHAQVSESPLPEHADVRGVRLLTLLANFSSSASHMPESRLVVPG